MNNQRGGVLSSLTYLQALVVIASFYAGFAFDRWLHRPIVVHFTRVSRPATIQTGLQEPAITLGGEPVIAQPKDGPRWFETMDAAATFALTASYDLSPYYEYGGVIVKNKDGKFAVSPPDTDYHGDSLSIEDDPLNYEAFGVIVADYHTHPCLPKSHEPGFFSPPDLQGSRTSHTVGYMLDTCTGDVHKWAPGDPLDEPHDLRQAMGPKSDLSATGQVIGHIHVSGTVLEK